MGSRGCTWGSPVSLGFARYHSGECKVSRVQSGSCMLHLGVRRVLLVLSGSHGFARACIVVTVFVRVRAGSFGRR